MEYQDFEENNLNDRRLIQIISSYNNINYIHVKDIDSKKKKNKEIRKILKNNSFSNKNSLHINSSLRGDIMYISENNQCTIIDSKFYIGVNNNFKFPNLIEDKNKFIKTIDSNIKLALEILNLNYFSLYTEKLYTEFINKAYSKFKTKNILSIDPIKIRTITDNNFKHILCYMELGYGYDKLDKVGFSLTKDKFFVSKNDETKIVRHVNFENIVLGDVTVSLYVSPIDNYIYLLFSQDDIIIYILSQRSNMKKSNCAFINKNYVKTVETLSIIK